MRATLAFAVILATLSAIILTSVAIQGSLMPGDRALADALQTTPRGRFLEPPADWLALWYVEGSMAFIFAWLALRRRTYGLAAAVVLVTAAAALNPVLKEAIQRDRPAVADLVIREPAAGYGFPSGHSMSAALWYGYALVVAWRLADGRVRLAIMAACLAAMALIGWDRVYDGAHWPSDVAGGWAIGGLLLGAAIGISALGGKLWRRLRSRPGVWTS